MERYSAQLTIPEIGVEGQEKLAKAKILVIGAGGLGSVLLYSLTGAGIGHIGIIDHDTVTLSNLNRQFLHNTDRLHETKVYSAFQTLHSFNPDITIETFDSRIDENNASEIIFGFDLVILAVDNLQTRLLVNRICARLYTPFINGGIDGMYGMLQFVDFKDGPCLECMYADTAYKKPSSLGSVVGVISALMAQCAILYALRHENPIPNRMLYFDGTSVEFISVPIKKNPDCSVCS